MFKQSHVFKIFFVVLTLFWIVGCASTPERELTDIDNVLTEKAKKAALAQAKKATEQTSSNQSSNAQTVKAAPVNKPLYPIITPTPIMRPVTVPNPVLVNEPSEREEAPSSVNKK